MPKFHRKRRGRHRKVKRPQAYCRKIVRRSTQRLRPHKVANASQPNANNAAVQRRTVAREPPLSERNQRNPTSTTTRHGSSNHPSKSTGEASRTNTNSTGSSNTPPPSFPIHPSLVTDWIRAPVKAGSRRVYNAINLTLQSLRPKTKRNRCKKARRKRSNRNASIPSQNHHPLSTQRHFQRPTTQETPTRPTRLLRNLLPSKPTRRRRLPPTMMLLAMLVTAALSLLPAAVLAPTTLRSPANTTLINAAPAPATKATATLLQSTGDEHADPSGCEGDAHSL